MADPIEQQFKAFISDWNDSLEGHEDPAHVRAMRRVAITAWANGAFATLRHEAQPGDELTLAKIMSGATQSAAFELLEYPDDD